MFQGVACQMGLLGVAWLFTIGAQAVEVKPKGSVLFQDDFQDGRIGPSWSVVEHRDETAKTPTYFRAFRESVEGKDVWVLQGLSEGSRLAVHGLEWKDYELTFQLRIGERPNSGELLRLILRHPESDIWSGSTFFLLNDNGKWKMRIASQEATLPVDVDTKWHAVLVRAEGTKISIRVDGKPDATFTYEGSVGFGSYGQPQSADAVNPYGGFSLGFEPSKWAIANVKVTALSQTASSGELLARCCLFSYYPGLKKIAFHIDLSTYPRPEEVKGVAKVACQVRQGARGLTRCELSLDNKGKADATVDVPDFADGDYELTFEAKTPSGEEIAGTKPFKRRHFPWEGNKLGITEKIYPPFLPVEVKDRTVEVVLRKYEMNEFGLWNKVVSQRRDLLAAPVSIRFETGKGEGKWTRKSLLLKAAAPQAATYEGLAESGPVKLASRSTIEFDGCMKVEFSLSPGPEPETISRLWVEIPLNEEASKLFHYSERSCRRNVAGRLPDGGKITWILDKEFCGKYWNPPRWKAGAGPRDGVLWTSQQTCGWTSWNLLPYIWLGGAERGLAWFADNDKGWILDNTAPCQTVSRENGKSVLRVYLVNAPAKLQGERRIVFGLQASPTRPMPKNWRSTVAIPSHSGPVNCWGSFGCSDKYPVDHDFSIADKILDARRTNAIDRAFFEAKDKTRSFPKYGPYDKEGKWLDSVLGFAEMAKMYNRPDFGSMYPDPIGRKAKQGPLPIYFEEHCMVRCSPEYEIFQDEWNNVPFVTNRVAWARYGDGVPYLNTYPIGPTFSASYRDFCAWYANQWLQRGVGLYFDNNMIGSASNPLTSAAYTRADGSAQSAATLWAQREYYKRIWNLMCQWNEKGAPYPLTYTQHMTNTLVLPFNTWNTANLDNEFAWIDYDTQKPVPYPWDFLLAEMTGRQSGSYAHALYPISGIGKGEYLAADRSRMKDSQFRREWGIRVVHEISRWLYPFENFASMEPARTLEVALYKFGYGSPNCEVHNYWADKPALRIANEDVKWLLVSRPKDRKVFLVLQSWLKTPGAKVTATFDEGTIGFKPSGPAVEAADGKPTNDTTIKGGEFTVSFPDAYGTRVLIFGG